MDAQCCRAQLATLRWLQMPLYANMASSELHYVSLVFLHASRLKHSRFVTLWQDMPKPRARSNAMMTVAGDTLWLFGGIVEVCDVAASRKCHAALQHL